MNWKEKLLKKRNVVLVGDGKKITAGVNTGRDCVVVGVVKKLPLEQLTKSDIVPKRVKGMESDVIQVGEIKLLNGDAKVDRISKLRPAPGGCSIGHYQISAGTLGMVVKKDGVRYILSNNHILSNLNEGEIGDDILQPGKYDIKPEMGNCEIAKLSEFIPIKVAFDLSDCPIGNAVASMFNFFAKMLSRRTKLIPFVEDENTVDCALAKPNDEADVLDTILEIGEPKEVIEPLVGMRIKKSGRTTGLTHGEITAIDVTVNVGMGDSSFAIFVDQIAMGAISEGGDSGSIILTENNEIVGLLFAGSDTVTLANRWNRIKESLGVELPTT